MTMVVRKPARVKPQASNGREQFEREKTMKNKISAAGLILGAVVGVVAAAFLGKWILWLGLGLAIGLAAGSVRARRLPAAERGKQLEARS
jgi:uncharacterized membrane protein YoaK (UPF0700 family)